MMRKMRLKVLVALGKKNNLIDWDKVKKFVSFRKKTHSLPTIYRQKEKKPH